MKRTVRIAGRLLFWVRIDHADDMADLHYTDPYLVALYDAFNGWSVDRDFYAALPGKAPVRVLEVGCGTGLIARAIAGQGHDVVGLDPAQPMLDWAKAQPDGGAVEWVRGILADYRAAPFDLIYMTGHAFQCLLTDDEIAAHFVAVRRLLKPQGRFVFETRNPSARGWEKWTPDHTRRDLNLPDGTRASCYHDVTEVDGEFVSFSSVYGLPNEVLTSTSTLRFASLATLTQLATSAGLCVSEVFGDWDKSALTDQSPEIIATLAPM